MRYSRNVFFEEDGGAGTGAGSDPVSSVSTESHDAGGDDSIVISIGGGDGDDSNKAQSLTDQSDEGQQEQLPAYFSQLKKEAREKYKSLAKYGSLEELAEIALKGDTAKEPDYSGYVKVPTKDSTKEELREFLTKMGVPETPDKYDIKTKENAGPFEKAIEKTVKEQAFRSGLSSTQAQTMYGVAQAVVDFCLKEDAKAKQERRDGFDARYEELYKEQYPNKTLRDSAIKEDMGYLQNFLSETGLTKALRDSGAIYDENIMKALAQYHKKMKGSFKTGPSGSSGGSGASLIEYGSEFINKYGGKH